MNFLHEEWKKEGNNIIDFWNNLNILDEKITSIKTCTDQLTFYSIQNKKDNILCCSVLKPYNIWQKFKSNNGLILGLKQRLLDIPSWLKSSRKEYYNMINDTYLDYNNRLLMSVNDEEPCFISTEAIRGLGKLIYFSSQCINNASLERDTLLCKLCENETNINIIMAEDKGVKKIMSILPNNYIYENQIIIKELHDYIVDKINEYVEYDWIISHEKVELYMYFSNNIIFKITNSNQGHLAFGLTCYINGKEEFSKLQKHNHEIDFELFKKGINKIINKSVIKQS